MLPDRPHDKTADVFFAGDPRGLPARENGLAELARLRAQGVVVDVPDRRLDRQEFYQRCAGARLVWSPEGYGWDCFRHYEAAACGSVPLINYPSILRYRPLEDGTHCLYYAPEPGGLEQRNSRRAAGQGETRRDGRERARSRHPLSPPRDHRQAHRRQLPLPERGSRSALIGLFAPTARRAQRRQAGVLPGPSEIRPRSSSNPRMRSAVSDHCWRR